METPPSKDRYLIAVFYCVMAHLSFAIMGACAKVMADDYHVAEIVFYRNFIIFLPLLAYIILAQKTHLFHTQKPKLVGLRAIIGGISLMVTFAALIHLPMSYATILFFTSVLITPILAVIFLRETVGIHRWSAVLIGFIGVIIVAQPSGEISMFGLVLALISAFLHAIMFTVLRGLKDESPITVTFYFVLIGWIFTMLFLPWVGQGIINEHISTIILIAISGASGQLFLVNAFKHAPASYVTPFGYSALIWTSLFDIYFWKYDLAMVPLLTGASLILSAQVYILYREYHNKRKKAKQ